MFGNSMQSNQHKEFAASMAKVGLVFLLQILILLRVGIYMMRSTMLFSVNPFTPALLIVPALVADLLWVWVLWQRSKKASA